MSTSDPDWTDLDRGLLQALLAERADICPMCGHPMSQCRDPRTAYSWELLEQTCNPSRVAQAAMENAHSEKRRGVVVMTRRKP